MLLLNLSQASCQPVFLQPRLGEPCDHMRNRFHFIFFKKVSFLPHFCRKMLVNMNRKDFNTQKEIRRSYHLFLFCFAFLFLRHFSLCFLKINLGLHFIWSVQQSQRIEFLPCQKSASRPSIFFPFKLPKIKSNLNYGIYNIYEKAFCSTLSLYSLEKRHHLQSVYEMCKNIQPKRVGKYIY